MVLRIFPALLGGGLLICSASLAQPADNDSELQNMPEQIRQKLSEQGFKDIKVVPGSFIVSARDKDGNPVMMLIGPGQMTVLSGKPDEGSDPSIAQSPDPKGEIYKE